MPKINQKSYVGKTFNDQANTRGGSGIFMVIGVFIGILIVAIVFMAYYLFYSRTSTQYSAEMNGQLDMTREQGNYKNTFADGWAAARQHLIDKGFIMADLTSISGTIKEINDDNLVIAVGLINPLDDEGLKERIIHITTNTQIIKNSWVNSDSDNEDPAMLGSLKEETISLADLSVGNSINVEADKTISDQKEINAVKVIYNDMNNPSAGMGMYDDIAPPTPIAPGDAGYETEVPPPPVAE